MSSSSLCVTGLLKEMIPTDIFPNAGGGVLVKQRENVCLFMLRYLPLMYRKGKVPIILKRQKLRKFGKRC